MRTIGHLRKDDATPPFTIDSLLGVIVLPAAVFSLAYFPLMSQVSSGLVSAYPKADIRKRIYAAAIDSMLLVSCWMAYQRSESLLFVILGAVYLLLRDGVRGASVGKVLFGLVVINLETGKPATLTTSMRRNAILLVPGANLAAVVLELITISRDVQGQRLGDRLAQTQVVEGFGARDLVDALLKWWQSVGRDLARAGRRVRATRFGSQQRASVWRR